MKTPYFVTIISGALMVFAFQNCSHPEISLDPAIDGTNVAASVAATPEQTAPAATSTPNLDVCQGVSCSLNPLTQRPAVVTILLALGDQSGDNLVIAGSSSQLIAETLVRNASPVKNPRILIVQDINSGNEDPEDAEYLKTVLLKRFQTTSILEPNSGLSANDLVGYDLVWINNPGHPMGSSATRDTLLSFKGGVILQGDDMAQGRGFSIASLTGLEFKDNGMAVNCKNQIYPHDNNSGFQYTVTLNSTLFPKTSNIPISFKYGNDIDLGLPINSNTEVLATAVSGVAECPASRPVITRVLK